MGDFDIEKFLSTPIDAFDFQVMIGDAKDFLEFSEENLDWQYRREMQAIARRDDISSCPSGYREHLETNAGHRFKVSLPLRIRYGALLAFTTSVEWAVVGYLHRNATSPVPKAPKGTNPTVNVLRELCARASLEAKETIQDYEALTKVRNCVAHSAGIVATYQYKDDMPEAVRRLSGFSLANWHFFGEVVCIERGALEKYMDATSRLVVALHTAMREKHLLK